MGSSNSFFQAFFDRGLRLAAGLAIVVAIPMAVLFYFQFRSLDDLEETSEVVLRQLSSDTAESLTRSVEDYLKRPHISVLLRITQGRTEPLDLPFIEPVFNDALTESPFVESFFVWTERGPLFVDHDNDPNTPADALRAPPGETPGRAAFLDQAGGRRQPARCRCRCGDT